MDEEDMKSYKFAYYVNREGAICAPDPKTKINALLVLFGAIYIVLTLYTIMRNVCSKRIV